MKAKIICIGCKEMLGGCFLVCEDDYSRLYKINLPGFPANLKPKDVVDIDPYNSNVQRISMSDLNYILSVINKKTFY